jgi:hypothetical protein
MKDAEYFKEMLEELDAEGRFNDTMPNVGVEYDVDKEMADLSRYQESLNKPGSLSFLGV